MPSQLRYLPRSNPLDDVAAWLNSPALRRFVESSDGRWPTAGGLIERLQLLVDFSEVWDRRRGGARHKMAAAADDDRAEAIPRWATELGLDGTTPPTRTDVEVVLVLGGYVTACVRRVEHLFALLDGGRLRAARIALLGSYRHLEDWERDLDGLDAREQQFAALIVARASTEVDVLMGLADVLLPSAGSWRVLTCTGDPATTPRLAELVARRGGRPEIWALAAPSSAPTRRPATTGDTLDQAVNRLEFRQGSSNLVVTSHLYALAQHWHTVRIVGVPRQVEVETIGTPPGTGRLWRGPSFYAQELRSTLLSALLLAQAFSA